MAGRNPGSAGVKGVSVTSFENTPSNKELLSFPGRVSFCLCYPAKTPLTSPHLLGTQQLLLVLEETTEHGESPHLSVEPALDVCLETQ